MNIAAIFSAFLGSKEQAKSDVAEAQGTDFIGFVWESDVVDKFFDANAPWPEANTIQPGAQDAQPDMHRILTEQAGAISEIGHFLQPKPAIQPIHVQAEIPDQTVAVPAGAPVNVLVAPPLAPDTPFQDHIAPVASVDLPTPDIPTQTQSAQSAANSYPDTPDRQEFQQPRAAAAPPEPPTVHMAAKMPDASQVATQPEPQLQADPAVLPELPEISRAAPPAPVIADTELKIALAPVAGRAQPQQTPKLPAALAAASPPTVNHPQMPAANDLVVKYNPLVSKPAKDAPSHRVAQSPLIAEQRPSAPVREIAQAPERPVHNEPKLPRAPRASPGYNPEQYRKNATSRPAHRSPSARAVGPTVVPAQKDPTIAQPITQLAFDRTLKEPGPGKLPGKISRSRPMIMTAEYSPSRGPNVPQIVQHSSPTAAPPAAHSPATPLAAAPVTRAYVRRTRNGSGQHSA